MQGRGPGAEVEWGGNENRPRILACEDDPLFQRILEEGLELIGLPVVVVPHGQALEAVLDRLQPDIVLLDVNLPGEGGLSIAGRLRQRHPHLGLVMLTGNGGLHDRLKGFSEGADLYLVKPIPIPELAASLEALYRRMHPAIPLVGGWRLDGHRSCLRTPSGEEVLLTQNELLFLACLFEQAGRSVGRDELMRALGNVPGPQADHRLETLLSRLRRKVSTQAPGHALPVKARHGLGYALLPDSSGR